MSPPASLGVRAALGGTDMSTRRLARSTLLAIFGTVTCLVAALVWTASARNLVTDFTRQGWNFDVSAPSIAGGSLAVADRVEDALRSSRDVETFVWYRQATVPFGGADIDVISLDAGQGRYSPIVIGGRAPSGPDEVAIGTLLAHRSGLKVGDPLTLPGTEGPVRSKIVGTVVFPSLGNTSYGLTVLMTPGTMGRVSPDPPNQGFLLRLAPGADMHELRRSLGGVFSLSQPFSPPSIVRLHDASGTVRSLAAFFAVLGIVAFAFAMVTSTQRRRRELAIARAIGFDRRQVDAACRWQGGISLLVGGAVALPVGIVAGRTAWRLSSRNLGILDATSVPLGELALVLLAGGFLVVVVSWLVAIGPARGSIAQALHAE